MKNRMMIMNINQILKMYFLSQLQIDFKNLILKILKLEYQNLIKINKLMELLLELDIKINLI